MNKNLGEKVLEFRTSGNKTEPHNHGLVWVVRDPKDYLIPIPMPWAGTCSTTSGCSKPWPCTTSNVEPQPSW